MSIMKMTPKNGNEARKGYATYPRKKWDDPADKPKCSRCGGTGMYMEENRLRTCPRCNR